MWVSIQTVDEDDIDKSATDGGIDLCEAEPTDLWSARGCLEKVSTSGKGPMRGRRKTGTYHHGHTSDSAAERRGNLFSRRIYVRVGKGDMREEENKSDHLNTGMAAWLRLQASVVALVPQW